MDNVKESTGRALHVGVNAHLLSLAESYRSAGINWHIYNLLQHLPEVAPEIAYTVFLSERRYRGTAGMRLRTSRLPTHRPQVRILWEQILQPWSVRQAGIDLLHSPAFVGPLASKCPTVITVHDLSFLFFPQNFRAMNRVYLQALTRLSARRARRVIAVSESTKRDLVEEYGLSPAKVDVVYNGVDTTFRPLPASEVAAFRQQAGLPERFILFVGTLEPRKNVARLVEAYARLPEGRPPLLLVGGKGWLYDEIFSRVEELDLSGEVRHVGYVPAETLPLWFNAAELFVYPSLYEGFGLPPLEALACGTAVVASSASSLPEVVGEAGLLVDPLDTEALAAAMDQVLANRDRRERLREAGPGQAQGFTWQKAARHTVTTYRQALGHGEGRKGV
jgi:glycosyltransferase involved in cell wall biosynthesis